MISKANAFFIIVKSKPRINKNFIKGRNQIYESVRH